ncbi:MAG: peroxide stress protein YaaA [Rhodobacteraceae bacterium]|nr:peroxide stress protein YaaA [Paracoccaceae bacterium]
MLVVISPAKRLDWTPVEDISATDPAFAGDAVHLAGHARGLSAPELQKLMSISADLAKLNAERFATFSDAPDPDETRPAARAFAGDTYAGLEAGSLEPEEIDYAQRHLRILSGLYGVLRPKDAIQPYRLEMGSKLKTERGKSLYDYWGDRLALALNDAAAEAGSDILVNCASQEYFGAVDPKALKLRVITPVFMEDKNGTPKIVSFYAKKARGAMARFIVQRRVTDIEGLKEFDLGGYRFRSDMSEGDRLVFLRGAEASAAA